MNQNKIGIIGCGWLGLPLAKEFVSNNYKVKGSTTTKEKLEILKNEGIDAYLIDVAENSISDSFESFLYELDILIVNIPPKIRKDANSNYSEKIKELVKQANKVKNILFISSTSVYGSMQGKIDSNTIALPDSENGKEILKTSPIKDAVAAISLGIKNGEVLIDGQTINSIGVKNWIENISYVSQRVYLFNTSLRNNITLKKQITKWQISIYQS